jgi:hypothetical protein
MCNNKQYIAVSVGGSKEHPAGQVIVFTLNNK